MTHHHDHELPRRLQAADVRGKVLHLSIDTNLLEVSASNSRKADLNLQLLLHSTDRDSILRCC
jgi:hypothetical protein